MSLKLKILCRFLEILDLPAAIKTLWKLIFMIGFSLELVLKQRYKVTRKRPITLAVLDALTLKLSLLFFFAHRIREI